MKKKVFGFFLRNVLGIVFLLTITATPALSIVGGSGGCVNRPDENNGKCKLYNLGGIKTYKCRTTTTSTKDCVRGEQVKGGLRG